MVVSLVNCYKFQLLLMLLLLLLLAILQFVLCDHHVDCCQFTKDGPATLITNKYHLIESCDRHCRIEFKGNCRCNMIRMDGQSSTNVRLQCSQTNASMLLADIDNLSSSSSCNLSLTELQVVNSNLTRLYHLPSGLYNIHELVLDNTGIDLETIRESNELLKSLKILRISNENYTEIPETLFNGMDELKELSLNNLGLAYVSVDAFVSLQDSLTLLELRSNRIRTIPNAVQMLSHLECLDLSSNNIKTISDANTVIFSIGLKRLKRLRINLNKCSCEFGKSKFATWLRTYAIKGVNCNIPDRLIERDVSNTPVEEFCETSANGSNRLIDSTFNQWKLICLIVMILWFH